MTHWRSGTSGNTSSASRAAVSALAPASLYLLHPCSRRPCGGRHSWGRTRVSCRKMLPAARSGICRSAPGETRARGDRTSGKPRIPCGHGLAGICPAGLVGPRRRDSVFRRVGRAVSARADGVRRGCWQSPADPVTASRFRPGSPSCGAVQIGVATCETPRPKRSSILPSEHKIAFISRGTVRPAPVRLASVNGPRYADRTPDDTSNQRQLIEDSVFGHPRILRPWCTRGTIAHPTS